jgi:ADP-ribose pyrophosphatase
MPSMQPKILKAGKYLRLVKLGNWEFAERTGALGAVAIAAVTDQAELVLVEQDRPPMRGPVIELPAGLVGDVPGESVDDWRVVARRELLEETGFRARRMVRVAQGPLSAGFSSESMALYLASGLSRVHAGGGVDHEAIRVHVVKLAGIENWLARQARRGKQIDLKIFAGLHFATRLSLPRAGR